MTTIVNKTVGTAVGRDYSTPQTAAAALPSSLVTADQWWNFALYADSEFVFSSALTLSGVATDSTHRITWAPAAGQGFADNANAATNALKYNAANGVAIRRTTGGSDPAIVVSVDWCLFTGLQIDGSIFGAFSQTGTAPNTVLSNSFCQSSQAASGFATVALTGATAVNVDSINSGGGNAFIDLGNGGFHNCSAYSNGATGLFGFRGNYTSPLYKNCSSFGFTTAFRSGNDAASDYNASSDTTAPGAHSIKSLTYANQVVSTTTDWRVKAGSGLIGAGTRDAAFTSDLDLLKQARSTSTPTIGANEYVVAGGGATLTGKSATTQAGALSSAISVGLTGIAVTGATGTLVPTMGTALVLAGQAGTFGMGAVGPASSLGLVGLPAVLSTGALVSTVSTALSGQPVLSGLGAVSSTLSKALSGQGALFGLGSLGPVVSAAAVGQSMLLSLGTLSTPGGVTVALTGIGAAFAAGSLKPTVVAAVNGQASTFATGTLTAGTGAALTLTGQAMTLGAGSLTASIASTLSGLAGLFGLGSLSVIGPMLVGPGVYFYAAMRRAAIYASSPKTPFIFLSSPTRGGQLSFLH